MIKILFKLSCICFYLLLIPLCAGYIIRYHTHGDFENSKQMNFKLSLLKQVTSPKIVVVGGSNTLFGVDCKRLSELTGYRAVNLGFNYRIGIRFGLETLGPYLSNDDIVIVSPEYENFFDDNIYYGSETVAFLVSKNAENLSSYYLSSIKQVASIYRQITLVAFKYIYINYMLGRSTVLEPSYNQFGDRRIDKVGFSTLSFDDKVVISPEATFNDIVVKDLIQYKKSAKAKGARLVIAYPFIPSEVYKINQTKLELVHNKLESAGLEILAPPSESFAAKLYFEDFFYHLNPVGRILRTDAIFQGIKKYIKEQKRVTEVFSQ